MNQKQLASAVVIACMLVGSTSVLASDWSDAWVGYQYQYNMHEPGVTSAIKKNIVELGYVGGDKYGTNLIVVDNYFSDSCYPAAPANPPFSGGACRGSGSLETYAVLRRSLSLSAMSGSKVSFGPVRDVSLTGGLVYGTQNTVGAYRPIKLTLGPTLNFAVKNGFWDLGLWIYKETNNNGYLPSSQSSSVSFKPTWNMSTAWSVPLAENVSFSGYGDIVGPKGPELFYEFTGKQSKTEYHFFPKLLVDVGAVAGGARGVWKAGFGVEMWRNKYGSPAAVGTNATSPTLLLEAHF